MTDTAFTQAHTRWAFYFSHKHETSSKPNPIHETSGRVQYRFMLTSTRHTGERLNRNFSPINKYYFTLNSLSPSYIMILSFIAI